MRVRPFYLFLVVALVAQYAFAYMVGAAIAYAAPALGIVLACIALVYAAADRGHYVRRARINRERTRSQRSLYREDARRFR